MSYSKIQYFSVFILQFSNVKYFNVSRGLTMHTASKQNINTDSKLFLINSLTEKIQKQQITHYAAKIYNIHFQLVTKGI